MELKQFSELREHLEYYLQVKSYPGKSLTRAGRNLSEIIENFVFPYSKEAAYGIRGLIKNHYIMKGYQAREEVKGNGMWFKKDKKLIYANIGISDSRIMISVLNLDD